MSRSAKPGVSGAGKRNSTRTVEHRSTEPRVGSSNLSGRATRSGNSKNDRNFLAACIAADLSEESARRLLAALRVNAHRAYLGHITADAAVEANRALAGRVLSARPAVRVAA